MRLFSRFLKWTLVLVSGVLLLVFLSAATLWLLPSIWFNESTLRLASRFLPDFGVTVTWKAGAKVSAETTSLFGKRVQLTVDHLCVGIADANTDICVDHLDLDVGLLLRFDLEIKRVDKLVIQGATVVITEPKQTKTEESSSKGKASSPFELPLGLATANLGDIRLDLKRLKYRSPTDILSASGHVKIAEGAKDDRGLKWNAAGSASLSGAERKTENLKFDLAGVQETRQIESIQFIDLIADYRGSFYFPVHLKANLTKSQLRFDLSTKKESPAIIVGNIDLSKNKHGLFSRDLKATAKVDVEEFELLVAMLEKTPFAVPSPANVLKGPLKLEADYVSDSDKGTSSAPLKLTVSLQSHTQKLFATTTGLLEMTSEKGVSKTKLNVELLILEGKLVLPPLTIEKFPPIFPDSRIQTASSRGIASPKSEADDSFTYRFTIKTAPEHPLLIVTNLAKAPIPVELDIGMVSSRPLAGSIRFGGAPLDVLRRNASLKKAKIEFPGTETPPRLSAELSVKYSEYTVFVNVFGTTEKPDFFLTSIPPLSDEDALSVLLFGQTSSDLDSNQTAAVADTRAAVANRAVSLASMYLLATTPIESVGYDPVSNTVSARVRLRDGTTLQMRSSGRGVAGLGLRQSLGGPWSIRTEVENLNSAEQERSASALLEWSKRY